MKQTILHLNFLFIFLLIPFFLFAQLGETCNSAIPITTTTTINSNGPSLGNGCHNCTGGATDADWYSFTPSQNGIITISSCTSNKDTRLWLYEGDCSNLTEVGASDDDCGGFPSISSTIIDFSVITGTTYYLEWDNVWDNTAFDFDFTFTSNANICNSPTGLNFSAFNPNSGTLDFTSNGSEVLWEVVYGYPHTADFDQSILVTNTTPFLNNLVLGADYQVKVRAMCSLTDTSPFSNILHFSTPCPAIPINQFPYFENFSSLYPDSSVLSTCTTGVVLGGCWQNEQINDVTDWIPKYNAPPGSTNLSPASYLMYDQTNCIGTTAQLISPSFDTRFVSSLGLDYLSSVLMDTTSIYVTEDSGSTWQQVIGRGVQVAQSSWASISFDLNDFVGKPNIQIRIDANPTVNSYAITDIRIIDCTPPSDDELQISNITDTTAFLEWTSTGTQWEVAVLQPHENPSLHPITSNKNHTATNLVPSTLYYVFMKQWCFAQPEDKISAWFLVDTFYTDCPPTTDFTELFDEFTEYPKCYSLQSTGGTDWTLSDYIRPNVPGSGNEQGLLFSGNFGTSFLTSKKYDISGFEHAANFKLKKSILPSANADQLKIYYKTTNEAQWILLETFNAIDNDSIPKSIDSLIIPISSDPIQIGIEGTKLAGGGILIDDLEISEAVNCQPPSDLTVIELTSTTATFEWKEWNNKNQWEIEFGPSGFIQGSGTSTVATTFPFQIAGLSPETTYQYYVRTVCDASSGDKSDWTGPLDFQTPCVSILPLPYFEDFDAMTTTGDNIMPPCVTKTGDFQTKTYDARSIEPITPRRGSSNFAFVRGNNGKDNWLFSPAYNLTAGETYRFAFWYKSNAYDPNAALEIYLGNGPIDDAMTVLLDRIDTLNNTAYQEWVGTFTVPSDDIYHTGISFASTDTSFYVGIEDISMELVHQPTIISIAPNSSDSSQIIIRWTGDQTPTSQGAVTWELEYGSPGFALGTGITTTIPLPVGFADGDTLQHTITGLIPYASYHFYLRKLSPTTGNSNWTWQPYCNCEVPFNMIPPNTYIVKESIASDPNAILFQTLEFAVGSGKENIVFCADIEPIELNIEIVPPFSSPNLNITGYQYGSYITRFEGTPNGSILVFGSNSSQRLNIDNIEFLNSSNNFNGVLYLSFNGNASVKNCSFKNNKKGGMEIYEGKHIIENCFFLDNQKDFGAAITISNSDSVSVRDCYFGKNTALTAAGGAVNIIESQVQFVRDTFENNTALQGGAIYANALLSTPSNQTVVNLTDCIFSENAAITSGGSLFLENKITSKIDNCDFSRNFIIPDLFSAISNGGAITTSVGNNVEIVNSQFIGNYAQLLGGGIYSFSNNFFNISNTLFSKNSTDGLEGGVLDLLVSSEGVEPGDAIFINQANNRFVIDSSTIINHTINAIHLSSNNELEVSNSLFENNEKGILMLSSLDDSIRVKVTNTVFKNNEMGIAKLLFLDLVTSLPTHTRDTTSSFEIFNSTFIYDTINNLPLEQGFDLLRVKRGITIEGAKNVFIDNCIFQDIDLAYEGKNVKTEIQHSTFTQNRGSIHTFGAFDNDGLNLLNTLFSNNKKGIRVDTMTAGIRLTGVTIDSTGSANFTAFREGLRITKVPIIDIDSCFITNNLFNGGVYLDSISQGVLIENSIFSNNQDTANGGGLKVAYAKNVFIRNSFFNNNTSFLNGGSVYIENTEHLNLYNSTFENNNAMEGGGIYVAQANDLNIDTTIFSNNAATTTGAGFYLNTLSTGNFNLTNSTFSANAAINNGGGIYLDSIALGNFNISNTTFSGNNANNGGGFYARFVASGKAINIHESSLMSNSAIGNGGGIFLETVDSLYIANSDFTFNTATNGGAIYANALTSGALFIENSILSGNQASGNGGVLYNEYGNVLISNALLTGNQADAGGALYNANTVQFSIYQSTIAGNQANTGGAINTIQGNTNLKNTIVYENDVDEIIHTGNLSIDHSIVNDAALVGLGTNNKSDNPAFLNPIPASAAPTDVGDYRLFGCSPALDAGNVLSIVADSSLDGNPRIDRTIDIGAYEYILLHLFNDNNNLFCPGNFSNIFADTAQFGESYAWYNDNVSIPFSAQTVIANAAGTYHFALKCPNGTEGILMDSVTIDQIPGPMIPTVIHPQGTEICGDSLLLLVDLTSELTTYFWYKDSLLITDSVVSIQVGAPGIYYVEVRDTFGCENTSDFDTITTVNLPVSFSATNPYIEDFEIDDGGWQAEINNFKNDLTWQRKQPNGVYINTASSGNYAWQTNFLSPNINDDTDAFLISPCFDFSNVSYPMLVLDINSYNDERLDGMVIQYKTNSSDWITLGDTSAHGVNWYNTSIIGGLTGLQPDSTDFGWSGENDNWLVARQSLYPLSGLDNVRFRATYSGFYENDDKDGFAIDNIWIGERNRKVLLENFLQPTETAAWNYIDYLMTSYPNHVFTVNYITNGTNYTPYKAEIDARGLDYGYTSAINTKPYSIFEGKEYSGNLFENKKAQVQKTAISSRLLSHSFFDIEATQSFSNGGTTITTDIDITLSDTSLLRIPSAEITTIQAALQNNNIYLKVILVEDSVMVNGKIVRNVFREFLTPISGQLITGNTSNITINSSIDLSTVNTANLYSIAFLQNDLTQEIYQVEVTRPELALSTIPISSKEQIFRVYPNPTSTQLNIDFLQTIKESIRWHLVDVSGRMLKNGNLQIGAKVHQIEVADLAQGMYFLILQNEHGFVGREKVLIID